MTYKRTVRNVKPNLPRKALRVWSSLSTVREMPAISSDVMKVPQYARSTLTPRPSDMMTGRKQRFARVLTYYLSRINGG